MAPTPDASLASATAPRPASDAAVRAVFFVSANTGITAETLGSALLANFPDARFERHTVPFLGSVTAVDAVVGHLQRCAGAPEPAPPLEASRGSQCHVRALRGLLACYVLCVCNVGAM